MTKAEFIKKLRSQLSDLPKGEVEERLNFYNEMIDDKIEEGCSEERAVAEIGKIEEIARQIRAEFATERAKKQKIWTQRRLKVWEIALLALGSPVWLSLLIAAVAVVFSVAVAVYASTWAAVVSLWAAVVALWGSAFGGFVGGIVLICVGKATSGLAIISGGFVCAGLSIFLFYASKWVTKGTCLLAKKLFLCLKQLFRKKEVEL